MELLPAQILTAGYSYHSSSFYTGAKEGLPSYLLRYQTEGFSRVLIQGKWQLVEPGDLLLFKKDDPYELQVNYEENSMGNKHISSGDYFIFCQGKWIEDWWEKVNPPQIVKVEINERLLVIWRQIILERHRFIDENEEMIDYLMRILCLQAERLITEAKSGRVKGNAFLALRMKAFIEEHAVFSLKLEHVAEHAGISVSRAVHLFKATFGKTIIQYALEIRLSLAIERMRYSTMSLEQIAESCGFGSYSYFNRVFKASYGTAPKEYRLKLLQKE